MYSIGYDIGSSSIKAALVEVETGRTLSVVQEPSTEMHIDAPKAGWAEQDPDVWWKYVCACTKKLLRNIDPDQVKSVGVSYQMHGLVMVDKEGNVIRPSIIWCDSRAVHIGAAAFEAIGQENCLSCMLNSPGNFTASKLRWVIENEPHLVARCHKIMLPGDYIAYKLSGDIQTTASGLSEGVLWDFVANTPAAKVLQHYGIDKSLLPDLVPSIGRQSEVSRAGEIASGLKAGTPICYRAGDQPNNALSLGVMDPGEMAATGGTSGVVYGIVDHLAFDKESRVNGFAHVNHSNAHPRIGILLCVNGAGIQYGWLRKIIAAGTSYTELEAQAQIANIGSDGLSILPFGNGAERMLGNLDLGASWHNLQLNRHDREHLIRASLEGIAFAFVYGMNILKEMGLQLATIKVGNDNLFQSEIFSSTIANLTGAEIQMIDTTGAVGAAIASSVGCGEYNSMKEALQSLKVIKSYQPSNSDAHQVAFGRWSDALQMAISSAKE